MRLILKKAIPSLKSVQVSDLDPGFGRNGAAVTAVELDDHLLPVLDKTLEHYDNVRVVHGDIMRTDIESLMNHKPFKSALISRITLRRRSS